MPRAGITLSSMASDITGVSGRLMLQALIEGERDPAVLADLAKRRLRAKIPDLTEAFTDHHAFLARMQIDVIGQRTRRIAELNARIAVVLRGQPGADEYTRRRAGATKGGIFAPATSGDGCGGSARRRILTTLGRVRPYGTSRS